MLEGTIGHRDPATVIEIIKPPLTALTAIAVPLWLIAALSPTPLTALPPWCSAPEMIAGPDAGRVSSKIATDLPAGVV